MVRKCGGEQDSINVPKLILHVRVVKPECGVPVLDTPGHGLGQRDLQSLFCGCLGQRKGTDESTQRQKNNFYSAFVGYWEKQKLLGAKIMRLELKF